MLQLHSLKRSAVLAEETKDARSNLHNDEFDMGLPEIRTPPVFLYKHVANLYSVLEHPPIFGQNHM
jgi:hypothetical protein